MQPDATMSKATPHGLQALGNSAYAWLAPHASWGWSNAGLIVDGEESLLVDTLYDLPLTEQMLRAMRAAEPRAGRIDTLVNTHANGDHCHGNELVSDARIIASTASALEMSELPPEADPLRVCKVSAQVSSTGGPALMLGLWVKSITMTLDKVWQLFAVLVTIKK